jgi:class 3 adenylate cyclase/CHASE2 domain-containing sensor protein
VKLTPAKLAPALIASSVILLVCILRLTQPELIEGQERIAYDMRVRAAQRFSPPVSTNLGFVHISDESIAFVRTNDLLGYRYGLYWPRQVYGRLVEELSAQHAKAIAFDVIFGDLRPDHPLVQMANGSTMESDEFFALQLRDARNVILADTKQVTPPPLFATNALALGDISADTTKDSDGILRRAQAFHWLRTWHPLFRQVEADPDYGVDLNKARIEEAHVVLPQSNGKEIKIPIDADGQFELADFIGDKLPVGIEPKAKAFTEERIWQMGIVLAAQELGLDLKNPEIDLKRGRIILKSPTGAKRIIPVDPSGYFYIDWSISHNDPRLFQHPIQKLLLQDRWRLDGTNDLPSEWAGKLAIVGSSATGNDLTDRGATPLESNTLLASEHWNVANSILTGRFVQRSSLTIDLAIIVILGSLSAFFTWRLRILVATSLIALLVIVYTAFAWTVYIQHRYWLPVVLPVAGALGVTYVVLATWRVLFEQAEQRRVKSVFSRIVSPNIVHELLGAEKFSLGGARREVTVLFADIRGFTEFTDIKQDQAARYVAEHKLTDAEREAYFDEQARETLSAVNTYLALVADIVKKHCGTLDKYIGDCVMAFWGAPTLNANHARDCVKAAIETQRSLAELNSQRTEENRNREVENKARISAGLPERPILPVLTLGSGINTGLVTVGLMGSEAHISNYTVFGREVNLASRLESLSGRGRILISETTHKHLLRDAPDLAATCISLPDANLKGIRSAVKVYEVPWQPKDSISPEGLAGLQSKTPIDTAHFRTEGKSGI